MSIHRQQKELIQRLVYFVPEALCEVEGTQIVSPSLMIPLIRALYEMRMTTESSGLFNLTLTLKKDYDGLGFEEEYTASVPSEVVDRLNICDEAEREHVQLCQALQKFSEMEFLADHCVGILEEIQHT